MDVNEKEIFLKWINNDNAFTKTSHALSGDKYDAVLNNLRHPEVLK